MKIIRIGTRASKLALAQTEIVINTLLMAHKNITREQIEVVEIKTTGDKIQDRSLAEIGGKSLFTKEIENELLAGNIDLAVHSLKDFTSKLPSGLIINAFLPREDPRDAIVSFNNIKRLQDIKPGTTIGTSSCRRKSQLLFNNNEVIVIPLRGNVVTRISKIEAGEMNLAIMAMAGLNRLNINHNLYEPIELEQMLPAPGQGVICVECRENDDFALNLLNAINHLPTMYCINAERGFLEVLEADCQTAIAAHAILPGNNNVLLKVELYSNNGVERWILQGSCGVEDGYLLGAEFGMKLKDKLKK